MDIMSESNVIGVFHAHYIQNKNCFLYLHSKWLKKIIKKHNVVCVRIKASDGSNFLCSCNSTPFNYNGENTVGLNATFANSFGITEGLPVILFSVDNLTTAKYVSVKPYSSYDKEILESEFEMVQNSLLDQIRIVNLNQKLPIWISNWVVVNVYVCDIDNGCKAAKLAEYTEINVLHELAENINNNDKKITRKLREDNDNANKIITEKRNYWTKYIDLTYYLSHLYSWFVKGDLTKFVDEDRGPSYVCRPFADTFTMLPLVWLQHTYDITTSLQPYDVIVSERNLIDMINSFSPGKRVIRDDLICVLNYVPTNGDERLERLQDFYETVFAIDRERNNSNNDNNDNNDNNESYKRVYVRIIMLESLLSEFVIVPSHYVSCRAMFVSSTIQNYFNLTIGDKARLDLIYDSLVSTKKIRRIELISASNSVNEDRDKIIDAFKHVVSRSTLAEPIFLNNQRLYSIESDQENMSFFLQFSPLSLPFVYINAFDFDNLDDQLQWIENRCTFDKSLEYGGYNCVCEKIRNFSFFRYLRDVLQEEILSVITNLNLFGIYVDNNCGITGADHLLIEGGIGSGKSTVMDLLTTCFDRSHIYVFYKKLRCKTLKGKQIGKLEKLLNDTISECIYYQPALLILDDLDALIPISRSEDMHNIKYKQRLLNMLHDLFHSVSNQRISIIATASSVAHLGEYLFDSRGNSVFTYKVQLQDLTHEDKIQIFNTLLFDQLPYSLSSEINSSFIDDLMKKTEGYCIQDIVDFKSKLHFQLIKVQDHTVDVQVTRQHIENALEQVFPLAWSGVDLHKNTDITWANVGGLDDVKQILTEIIIWPSLYPEVFEQCPLKVQSGILLYGLPGSGKTLVAAAIAGECNINFISIKGPELLSKYTGSSEQKVRETFQKAHSAKPCILFFDEFESLAARRGNDVTGVTDRVVNQLLTEMDGIESRSGVWILAASSRPDLIDPALLRPGRLGTKVYCRMPNKDDRLSILNVLSSSYPLANDTDLKYIAEITDNYMGPDLQAVLYTAYSYNLCNVLTKESSSVPDHTFEQSKPSEINVRVNHVQLLRAVDETKPSLSVKERKKFEYTYELFSGRIQRTKIDSQKITQI